MAKAKKPVEPKIIHTWGVHELENLGRLIQEFKHQDDHSCGIEDIMITLYDNGEIELSAEFKAFYSEKIVI